MTGDTVPDPRAVLGMDVPKGTAPRAHEITRQGFRVDKAGVAAWADDFDHHDVAPKNSPGRHRG